MTKKQIPEPDLKLLIDFLRLMINPDLEFQAAYDFVMGSFHVQARLFKALQDRKDAFVDVKIKRKPVRVFLPFSNLPTSLVDDAFVESEQKKNDSLQAEIEKSQSIPSQPEKTLLNAESETVKRKGRGKAKKQFPARSLVSVLIDDTDIQLLNDLAVKHDSNVSRLVRLAVRRFLERG